MTSPAPGPVRQVGALVRLRAQAVRGPARYQALAGLLLVPALFLAAALVGGALPGAGANNARLLMPTAWAGFAATAVLAIGLGGARTLLPRDQLVAFPLGAGAEHLGALLLAPLNVAWVTQSLALVALAVWGFEPWGVAGPALVSTGAWIVASTVLAQAVGWTLELARTTRAGTWAVRGVAVVVIAAAGGVLATHRAGALLDRLPTVYLVAGVAGSRAGAGGHRTWLLQLAGIAVTAAAGYLAGVWLTGRLQRRAPRDQARVESRPYPRRPDPETDLAAALRIDRAGVWRSAPLRRGLLVLTAVPSLAAAGAGLEWPLVALLPGLVASGAGLLFGVNALSLDGSGVIWRESLPGGPRVLLLARLILVAEVCLLAAVLAAMIAAVRAPGVPAVATLVAVAGAAVATTAQVVGRCATWSVGRPYAATLRDARDQPAPPAAMAGYSARLALGTTGTGLLMSFCAQHGLGLLAGCLAAAITALGLRRAATALRRWSDPAIRSRVIAVVSG